jgi:mannose-6-phosphate isomerase-like protein (cupin superfamily)
MNGKELIESGIIELYVLGIADQDEVALIEQLAGNDEAVRNEIAAINDALASYALVSAQPAPSKVKEDILKFIQSAVPLPPKLTSSSTPTEWMEYLKENKFAPPQDFEGIYFLELPGNEDYYTYAVWGRDGDYVDEEEHGNHDEFLLICEGECEMVINGKRTSHKPGDFIEIAPGIPHSAQVTGKERMLVIGQRRAA